MLETLGPEMGIKVWPFSSSVTVDESQKNKNDLVITPEKLVVQLHMTESDSSSDWEEQGQRMPR